MLFLFTGILLAGLLYVQYEYMYFTMYIFSWSTLANKLNNRELEQKLRDLNRTMRNGAPADSSKLKPKEKQLIKDTFTVSDHL